MVACLKARKLVGVRGAGAAFDGLYYVKSVTHNIKTRRIQTEFHPEQKRFALHISKRFQHERKILWQNIEQQSSTTSIRCKMGRIMVMCPSVLR